MREKRTDLTDRLIVVGLCGLAIFVPHYAQYQMSPIAEALMRMGNMNRAQFVSVFSSMMYPAIVLAFLTGYLSDRFGIRRIVFAGMSIMTAGTLMRIGAASYFLMLSSMCLIGFGTAVINATAPKMFSRYFRKSQLPVIMGIYASASNVGMALGTGTVVLFENAHSALTFSAMLATGTALIWGIYCLPKDGHGAATREGIAFKDAFKAVASKMETWIVGAILMCVLGGSMALNALLPTALEERGVTSPSTYATAVTIGNMAGSLLVPLAAARLRDIRAQIVLLGLLSACGAAFAYRIGKGWLLYALLFITGMGIGGLFPTLLSLPVRTPGLDPRYAGTSNGLIVTLQMGGGVLISSFVIGPFSGIGISAYYLAVGSILAFAGMLGLLLPEYR